MNVSKRVQYIFVSIGIVLLWFFLSFLLRPVKIVAVHNNNEFSAVLVRHFPITDKGKIDWWLKNKDRLKNEYKIPNPASDGFFSITFWDFGDGYKEAGKYDRRCFDDMPTKKNCIEKNKEFIVSNERNGDISFITNGDEYHMKSNGDIIRIGID
ncbi:DUF943 family protein [Serratia rubidaea]|uniref:DUF943 family protein n=1 Tax=Serratia rubidaea TaxID=61652 RepID=A0ABS0MGZ1_SERRU|nr:DUF943 family protein [Serratia rubidaea]MBH1931620.1 DUF943 family protein [Serratia rubidaea]